MGITAAESQIMEALWRAGPLTSDEIITDVQTRQDWGAATVKTLINRLLKRKAIRSEPYEGRVRYRPLLEKADYLQSESQSLLDRLFDGRLAPLVSHFSERQKLTPQDIADLKRLIAELDDDDE